MWVTGYVAIGGAAIISRQNTQEPKNQCGGTLTGLGYKGKKYYA
jgi:hypothetical protein